MTRPFALSVLGLLDAYEKARTFTGAALLLGVTRKAVTVRLRHVGVTTPADIPAARARLAADAAAAAAALSLARPVPKRDGAEVAPSLSGTGPLGDGAAVAPSLHGTVPKVKGGASQGDRSQLTIPGMATASAEQANADVAAPLLLNLRLPRDLAVAIDGYRDRLESLTGVPQSPALIAVQIMREGLATWARAHLPPPRPPKKGGRKDSGR